MKWVLYSITLFAGMARYMWNGYFIIIILFVGRPIACEMGALKVFYNDNFICWQAHCMRNGCF